MQEGSVPSYQDRQPLFPGGSCYPLSGEGGSVKTDERLDQLNVIFGVIGTPDPEDVESIGTVRTTESECLMMPCACTHMPSLHSFAVGKRVY